MQRKMAQVIVTAGGVFMESYLRAKTLN